MRRAREQCAWLLPRRHPSPAHTILFIMPPPFLCSEDCPAASDISVFSGKVVNLPPSELCIIAMSFVEFRLEEIELVAETMKRVIRKWVSRLASNYLFGID